MQTGWADRLRTTGLRVTKPRQAVLCVLAEHPHSDAATVVAATRRLCPHVSVQGIYNVLDALVNAGLARRLQPAGAPALYELRVGDNHHHLVCRGCGAVVDTDCVVGSPPCLKPAQTEFAVDEAEVLFWGLCPRCRSMAPEQP
jgi:Fur family ferric uptake transcriptional regulator